MYDGTCELYSARPASADGNAGWDCYYVAPRTTYIAPAYKAPPRTTYVAPAYRAPAKTTVVVVKRPPRAAVYRAPVTEKCTPAVYNPTYNAYTPGGSYSYQYKRYIAGYCSPASKSKSRSGYYAKTNVRVKRITRLRTG